ncbi:hypothetical protein E5F05_12390 [Deinococcus metallilatus]|uniref:WD40 repeat domain-containing protein n=1 Tax=Deinococcus metallilatus TaxID=1211322 RepID=A0AAJ5F435_9DEIO|nr:hypothetical protein [Deinococcus metallilatus]MBB5295166.1 hypothetical protein [Deinococcus metallilatus]QBY08664.1 hypothetical protein E5F05_12390 [Deinococcus metallilatus]RXJ10543.1 hypothetical protein ERJ73_11220 [Deinococcus metallilatus]TLK26514.1 hypothetical protein FCS05_10970 [Deinococcus metallilatus]GMA14939.1 hypothetical protein GCM10025871_12700 [Deinococcus metallilatus]
MLALLLVAAASTLPVPPTPQVEITFPDAAPVTVTGPENSAQNAEYPWTHQQTLMSPRGDAAAVRFCWQMSKYGSCQVDLARPGQPVLELKNSNVTRLLWTADGKYLIGAGENTVRLWNLTGGSRAAVPRPFLGGKQQSVSHIGRLWLRDGDLCVAMNSEVFGPNGGYATGQLMTTTRYALPILKPLEIVTLPAREGQEAPCHMPQT